MKHIDFQYGVQYRFSKRGSWHTLSSNDCIDLAFDEPGSAVATLNDEKNKPHNKAIAFRLVRRAVTPWEEA